MQKGPSIFPAEFCGQSIKLSRSLTTKEKHRVFVYVFYITIKRERERERERKRREKGKERKEKIHFRFTTEYFFFPPLGPKRTRWSPRGTRYTRCQGNH
jgi:hypothetical protein